MPFNTAGFALILNLSVDVTNGINKISVFTNVNEKTKQTIEFAAATSNEYGGSVVADNLPLSFAITGGEVVQAIGLYHDTTYVAYIAVDEVTDVNDYVYVVDSITINLT